MTAPAIDRRHDHYPTRLEHAVEPIARIEPTVWARRPTAR